jgi:hypothetical protein
MKRHLLALGFLLATAAIARADEIRLKDGSQIVGTIVDFENDSFKIQTAYGFAMVRKDSIAQIIPAEPVKGSEAAKAAQPAPSLAKVVTPAPAPAPAVKPERLPAVTSASAPSSSIRPAPATTASPAAPVKPAVAATALPMAAPKPRPAPPAPLAAVAPDPTPAPAALAPLPVPVGPPPIRESVQGNLYANETYNFQLYRPPGWDVMPEARKALPNAITAMGTSDEATLFLVGREPLRDSLEAQAASSERALQKVYENYRQVSSAKRTVGGLPAVEWRFRGVADGHDWSVTALAIAHGTDVFTLLGMTYADSDPVIQIRENVIAKMIASLQFSAVRN